MFRLSVPVAALTSLAVSLSGCSKEEAGKAGYAVVGGEATGCLEGVVYDGVNKARVDLTGAALYVVLHDRIAQNYQLKKDFGNLTEAQAADLTGGYTLCDIPFGGQDVPLYLKLAGYQDYVEVLSLPSRTPNRGSNDTNRGFWVRPTVLKDLTIFKLNDLVTNDYTVRVVRDGAPVNGAKVMLVPQGAAASRSATLSTVTAETGIATFAATGLAFGSQYALYVYETAPVGTNGSTGSYGQVGTLTLGTAGTPTGAIEYTDVFSIGVDLSSVGTAPAIVSTTPADSLVTNGAVKFVFDRNIVEDAAGVRAVTVAIDHGIKADGTACTVADTSATLQAAPAANIVATIADNVATVTPNWQATPNVSTCKGFNVTYTWSTLQFYLQGSTILDGTGPAAATTRIYLSSPAQ
jgi:hypothetical protein